MGEGEGYREKVWNKEKRGQLGSVIKEKEKKKRRKEKRKRGEEKGGGRGKGRKIPNKESNNQVTIEV